MTFTNIIAQAAEGSAQQGGSSMILIFVLMMAAMWFMIIAPQRKRNKEHQNMLSQLKPGDEIMTSGGIFGTVQQVREDRIVVKIADSTRIEISKGYIGTRLPSEKDQAAEAKK